MPVNDPSGDWGSWLQSLIANQGAAAPYGPSGYPDNLPNRPYGPPGGALLGYPGATPGAPSMGYPAMGQPPAAAPPQQPPAFSIGAPNFANAVNPDFWHDLAAAKSKLGSLAGMFNQPGATRAPLGGNPSGAMLGDTGGYVPSAPNVNFPVNSAQLGDSGGYMPSSLGNGSPAAAATSTPGGMPARPVTPSPNPFVGNPPLPPMRPPGLGVTSPGRPAPTPVARGAGAIPTGATAMAPGPLADPNQRFGTFQYQAPNSVGSRAPIYTALNLFGGGGAQQPAPAAAPRTAIPPTATASVPNVQSNAPWWYGPLQQGNIWRGSGGPHS
jgi:hypothetical protein